MPPTSRSDQAPAEGRVGTARASQVGGAIDRVVVVMLVGSAAALAAAPLVMPDSYDWVRHTTSESAAQHVPGAWIARSGFVGLGLAVTLLAWRRRHRWTRLGTGLHAAFGVLMIGAAVFSSRPWTPAMRYSELEDALHSGAASLMGIAFIGGVVAVALATSIKRLDAIAVFAALAVPPLMAWWDGGRGALQRLMFLVAYAWYGVEALRQAFRDG